MRMQGLLSSRPILALRPITHVADMPIIAAVLPTGRLESYCASRFDSTTSNHGVGDADTPSSDELAIFAASVARLLVYNLVIHSLKRHIKPIYTL